MGGRRVHVHWDVREVGLCAMYIIQLGLCTLNMYTKKKRYKICQFNINLVRVANKVGRSLCGSSMLTLCCNSSSMAITLWR